MKSVLKRLFRTVATLTVAPLLITHFVCSRLTSRDSSLETHSQFLSLLPGRTGSYLRVAFYHRTLQHCDPSATISFGVLFSKSDAHIGKNVYIGPRCMLGCVTLEDDVLLGPAVQIPSGPNTHGIGSLDMPIRSQPGCLVRVTISRDSWIGAGSIVLADVGEQTVIGANSTVVKPVPARVVAVGSPAKQVANRETLASSQEQFSQMEIS